MRTSAAIIIAVASILCAIPMAAQNLVSNPSFELYGTCPMGFSQHCTDWVNGPTGTYDCLNLCSTAPQNGVPINAWGNQAPFHGQGYAQIITWLNGGTWREYLRGVLTTPLVAGQLYEVGFYWSHTDTAQRAQDRIGMAFTLPGPPPLNASVQTPPGLYLSDGVNWNLFSTTYTAIGGESVVTIGNFLSDAATSTIIVNPLMIRDRASIYVDVVFVMPVTVLPVELLLFHGKAQPDGGNMLQWATASERNNDRFEVERSMTGDVFTVFAVVPGAGSSQQTLEYSAFDPAPWPLTYYRLRQVDFDGTSTLSAVIPVQRDNGPGGLVVLQDIGSPDVQVATPQGQWHVQLMDISGRIISQASASNDQRAYFTLPGHGVFLIRAMNGSGAVRSAKAFH